MAQRKSADGRHVKSALRTIEVLEFLAERKANPPRLSEICEALDAPRSSVHALLRTLVATEWVTDNGEGFSLGIRALTVGTAYIDADPYVRIARPTLADLARSQGETFHMGRLDHNDVVYLLTQESERDMRTYSRVGRRLPAAVTGLGKAILMSQPERVPEDIPACTPHSLTNREELLANLEEARQVGYAFDAQENTLGLVCVAFPLTYTDPVRDAISCSVPIERFSPDLRDSLVEAMRAAAMRIVQSAPLA
ncbi:IclR family transcriptional regulator [Actinobaculum suis]|uniref:IclR family transcriptional regulator n=1 Tax=Actinobaculum suis TaxID=1657 RepID=A0A0K9ES49_9ACTO|nr:IclR family transcriptional regulator [Actinobaculum suis]KMY22701.1 IclR family transcriptional regulator [Actinobaculum suis]VDG75462.1 IclR family transcriptional regulator [Actinobaculum suis]